jgi:hypothetical protein
MAVAKAGTPMKKNNKARGVTMIHCMPLPSPSGICAVLYIWVMQTRATKPVTARADTVKTSS